MANNLMAYTPVADELNGYVVELKHSAVIPLDQFTDQLLR
jgi:hypothetical protein